MRSVCEMKVERGSPQERQRQRAAERETTAAKKRGGGRVNRVRARETEMAKKAKKK